MRTGLWCMCNLSTLPRDDPTGQPSAAQVLLFWQDQCYACDHPASPSRCHAHHIVVTLPPPLPFPFLAARLSWAAALYDWLRVTEDRVLVVLKGADMRRVCDCESEAQARAM